jgi:hypothetical protein
VGLPFILEMKDIMTNPEKGQSLVHRYYRNLSLGLVTKARACKGARQKEDPRGTCYTPMNARECERMNLHTLKATPTWGVGVPKDS